VGSILKTSQNASYLRNKNLVLRGSGADFPSGFPNSLFKIVNSLLIIPIAFVLGT